MVERETFQPIETPPHVPERDRETWQQALEALQAGDYSAVVKLGQQLQEAKIEQQFTELSTDIKSVIEEVQKNIVSRHSALKTFIEALKTIAPGKRAEGYLTTSMEIDEEFLSDLKAGKYEGAKIKDAERENRKWFNENALLNIFKIAFSDNKDFRGTELEVALNQLLNSLGLQSSWPSDRIQFDENQHEIVAHEEGDYLAFNYSVITEVYSPLIFSKDDGQIIKSRVKVQ